MLNKTCGESAMSYYARMIQPQTKYCSVTGRFNQAWIYISSCASSNYLSGAASGSTREETHSFSPCRAGRRHLQHQRFPVKRILPQKDRLGPQDISIEGQGSQRSIKNV